MFTRGFVKFFPVYPIVTCFHLRVLDFLFVVLIFDCPYSYCSSSRSSFAFLSFSDLMIVLHFSSLRLQFFPVKLLFAIPSIWVSSSALQSTVLAYRSLPLDLAFAYQLISWSVVSASQVMSAVIKSYKMIIYVVIRKLLVCFLVFAD